MDESTTRRRLPWGLLLTSGLLLLALLLVPGLRLPAAANALLPWRVLAALAAFLLLRNQQAYLWGVLAAILLPLHPAWTHGATPLPLALRAEALELVVLVGVTFAVQLTFQATFAWRSWLATAVVLVLPGALAWPAWPQTGLVAGLLTLLALLGAAILAVWRRYTLPNAPALANVATAVGLALAAPVAALLLAPVGAELMDAVREHWSAAVPGETATRSADQLLSRATQFSGAGLGLCAFEAEALDQWAWPKTWVALPLALWGLWTVFRRGWKQSHRGQPPLAWVLLLFALLDLAGVALHPRTVAQIRFLPLATLTVLLAVFGIADVVRASLRGWYCYHRRNGSRKGR